MKRPLTSLISILLLAAFCLVPSVSVSGEELPNILSLTADWSVKGEYQGSDYGVSVASAGDVNGDGYADIVIGAQNYPPVAGDSTKYGAVFIHLGGAGGIESLPQVTLANLEKGSWFGGAVSGAGDVNGDGFDDVIIGAPHKQASQGYNGAAYLYLGSASGVDAVVDWSHVFALGESEFGAAVSSAGDVNGDGFDDVLIGAPRYESSVETSNEGAVYLFFGSSTGLGLAPDWSFTLGQGTAQLGSSVSGLGDINQDGYEDFIVSAPTLNYFNYPDYGGAWIFYGSASGPADTYDWQAVGERQYSLFGSSVAGAGDVNGDGYLDVLIGARGYDSEFVADIGAAYIYYGSESGLATTPGWKAVSDQTYAGFGISVAGLGDVNLDGYADVAVGAPKYSAGESKEGAVFVYRGSNLGAETAYFWMAGGDKADADYGYSVSGAGDVNQDGKMDLLVGAPLYKEDTRVVMGEALAYYGIQAADATKFVSYLSLIIR